MIKEIYEMHLECSSTNSLIFVVLTLAVLVIVYFTTLCEQAQYKPSQSNIQRLHKELHQVLTFL